VWWGGSPLPAGGNLPSRQPPGPAVPAPHARRYSRHTADGPAAQELAAVLHAPAILSPRNISSPIGRTGDLRYDADRLMAVFAGLARPSAYTWKSQMPRVDSNGFGL
jgi:hypothetical protein